MRTLCVAGLYPWPGIDGYRQRLGQMIGGLLENGDVDFFCVNAWHEDREWPEPPEGIRLLRLDSEPSPKVDRVRRWVRTSLPRIMLNRTNDAARNAFPAWAADSYDLVYFSHLDAWWFFRDLVRAPTIVDLDNLEHLATRANRQLRPVGHDVRRWSKWLALQPVERVDEGRFERWQRLCAADVDVVTLCSSLDVARSGFVNAISVPNGCEVTGTPRDRRAPPGAAPQMSFVGLMSYGPNADAACWFATEVLPLVRREIPGATFRIVGRHGERLEDVAGLPGVEITGELDDLGSELDRADLAVVPIRFGAGTRLKVVEALANRIPVVTTTIGAEGIDIVDGQSALTADSAPDFAAACVRASTDAGLRARLIDEGAALYESLYRWSQIRAQVARLARDVAAGEGPAAS